MDDHRLRASLDRAGAASQLFAETRVGKAVATEAFGTVAETGRGVGAANG